MADARAVHLNVTAPIGDGELLALLAAISMHADPGLEIDDAIEHAAAILSRSETYVQYGKLRRARQRAIADREITLSSED